MSAPEGRLIVDRGASTYAEGRERDAVRGTGAHNTIRVGGMDQFDVWKSFRVGRRAMVRKVKTHQDPDYGYVTGRHDGYRSLGVEHRRTIFNLRIGGWLVVDEVSGKGWRPVESLLHLAPEVCPEVSGNAVALQPTRWSVALIGMPDVMVAADVYSPRLGIRRGSMTLTSRSYAELPLQWVYWIVPYPRQALDWSASPEEGLSLSTPLGSLNINLLFIEAY